MVVKKLFSLMGNTSPPGPDGSEVDDKERLTADAARLRDELAIYKHAFETTEQDRDRLAQQYQCSLLEQRDLADIGLGLLAHSLLEERNLPIDSIEGRLANLDEHHEHLADVLRSSSSDDSLRQRASDGLIRVANFLLRENWLSDMALDFVDTALKLDGRFRGVEHALTAYFRRRGNIGDYAQYFERGILAGEWPDGGTRHAQKMAIARGLPSVFLVTMPKSGSIFMLTTIMKSLSIPQFGVALSHDTEEDFAEFLLPSLAQTFAQGGCITQHHLKPAPENLEILKRSNLSRLVLHFRDPRQAAVSWWYYNMKIGLSRIMPQTQAEIEQVIWDAFLVPVVKWYRGWLDIADNDGELEILLSTQEEMSGNEVNHMGKVFDFLHVPAQERKLIIADKSSAAHFRKGAKDEWLDFFSNEFKQRSTDLIPNKDVERFGWCCIE